MASQEGIQVATPAKAGVQKILERLDSRLRGNDRRRHSGYLRAHELEEVSYKKTAGVVRVWRTMPRQGNSQEEWNNGRGRKA